MQSFIGVKLLSSNLTQPAIKPFEIYDNRLAGLQDTVQVGRPAGTVRVHFHRLRGAKLGNIAVITRVAAGIMAVLAVISIVSAISVQLRNIPSRTNSVMRACTGSGPERISAVSD